MTRHLGSIDAGLVGGPYGVRSDGPPPDEQVNIFLLAHRLLRGRYHLAIAAGFIGAVLGGTLGYVSQKPLYQCEGMVRIRNTVGPGLRGDGPDSGTIANHSTVINTHAIYLTQQAVIQKAVESKAWKDLGRPTGPGALTAFRNSLTVTTTPENELISVVFADKDPLAAKTGLEEQLTAYEDLYAGGETRRKREQTLRLLEDERRFLATRSQELKTQIHEKTKEFGTDDLKKLIEGRTQEQTNLDAEAGRLRSQLTERGARPLGSDKAATGVPPSGRAPSPEDIAASGDETMRMLLNERILLENDLANLLVRLKPEHRQVKQLKIEIANHETRIKDYAIKWNSTGKRIVAPRTATGPLLESTAQLQERLAAVTMQAEQWRAETTRIADIRLVVDALRLELDEADRQASENRARIDTTNAEAKSQAATGGRIEVTKPTQIPSVPTKDRRKKYALAGLVLGGGLPVMLVGLFGLLDGRLRFTYADQARETGTNLNLLGILPQLPKDLGDPEQAAAVAHCVHQMRTLLQIGGDQRKVYAITSATAGDGKTSLSLSLGLSFAASGSRTLLVDFDLVGHGLTSSLKVRPDRGIVEVLKTGKLAAGVMPTGIDRLWLLPAARDDDRFISRLSEHMVKSFVESVRAEYDIILIDTGPILGSLEANFVSSSADAVVLVVGRGQQRAHVQRAIEQLGTLRARVLGMVFNRADSADFMKSATSASFRSVRDEPASVSISSDQVPDLEPIARTVAMDVRR